MQFANTILTAVVLLPAAHCLAFSGPSSTSSISSPATLDGWTPKPTTPPYVPELHKRQFNMPVSKDTCGWLSGDYDSPVTCRLTEECAFYKSGTLRMQACIGSSSTYYAAYWYSSCADYANLFQTAKSQASLCNSECQSNGFVLKCYNLSPYCVTYTFLGQGVLSYDCSAERAGTQTVFPRATSDYTAKVFLPGATSSSIDRWTASANIRTLMGADVNVTNTDRSEYRGGGSSSGGGFSGGGGSSSGGSGSSGSGGGSSGRRKKKPSVGVIIGGVFAGLAVAVFVVACCAKGNKGKKAKAQAKPQPGSAATAANAEPKKDSEENDEEAQQLQAQPKTDSGQSQQSAPPGSNGYFAPVPNLCQNCQHCQSCGSPYAQPQLQQAHPYVYPQQQGTQPVLSPGAVSQHPSLGAESYGPPPAAPFQPDNSNYQHQIQRNSQPVMGSTRQPQHPGAPHYYPPHTVPFSQAAIPSMQQPPQAVQGAAVQEPQELAQNQYYPPPPPPPPLQSSPSMTHTGHHHQTYGDQPYRQPSHSPTISDNSTLHNHGQMNAALPQGSETESRPR